jgi:virginiamycin A acetyltransferase
MVKAIRNLFRNIYFLLKTASRNEQVYWSYIGSSIVECDIHEKTKLYKFHSISYSSIGKGTYISQNARITNTRIGKFCSIGPNLLSGWGIHPIDGISTSPVFYSTHKPVGFTYSKTNKVEEKLPITIGNDVFIGANVTILDGMTIGDGAVIGAGAVVSKDIPPYAVAVGCPIKIVKYRFQPEVIQQLLEKKWWDADEETLKKVERHFFDVETFLQKESRPKQKARQSR